MNFKNKWAYGIGIALLAIGGALVALFDGDEKTSVDWGNTIEQVQTSIEVIKEENPVQTK